MKVTHTIIAFVVLLALGGAFYYLNQQPEKPAADAIPKEKLFSFAPDQVEEFTLEQPPQPAATIRRVAGSAPDLTRAPSGAAKENASRWEIVTPAGIAADNSLIQSFLDELPNLQTTPLEGDAATPVWSEYGLDQPQRAFQFKLKDGKTVSISIGKENPSGYARYGRRDTASTVLLLDTTDTKTLIEKTLFDLRDKRILPLDMNQATRLELRFDFRGKQASSEEIARARELGLPTKPNKIVVLKQPNGNWQLSEPTLRTDYGNTNYLVTIVSGGLMKAVEEEQATALARYGLDRPQIRLEVTTPAGAHSLLVGNEKKIGEEQYFYAKNSTWPHVFTILRTVYDQLNQDLDGYRNRYVFDFETSNARRLEILGPAGEMRFDKKGEGWVKTGSPEKKMAESKVETFLNDIHALRIQTYTTDEPGRFAAYGLDKPWLKVKVTFGERNQEETIVFGRKEKKFFAARQGEPSVYEMSPNEPANLETKLKDLSS